MRCEHSKKGAFFWRQNTEKTVAQPGAFLCAQVQSCTGALKTSNRSYVTTVQRLRTILTPLLAIQTVRVSYLYLCTRKRTKALVSCVGIPSRIGTPASWGVCARKQHLSNGNLTLWEGILIPAGRGIHSAARTGDFRGNNAAKNRLFFAPPGANMPPLTA